MEVIDRPRAGQSPVSTISTPLTAKAPTAAEKSSVAADASSNAAPGVDHANASGMRYRKLSTIASTPWTTHSARSPDAACADDAPTATSPAMTSANELANPVTAATIPAAIGCSIPPLPTGQA
jgi:hypothetical protein